MSSVVAAIRAKRREDEEARVLSEKSIIALTMQRAAENGMVEKTAGLLITLWVPSHAGIAANGAADAITKAYVDEELRDGISPPWRVGAGGRQAAPRRRVAAGRARGDRAEGAGRARGRRDSRLGKRGEGYARFAWPTCVSHLDCVTCDCSESVMASMLVEKGEM